MTLFSERIHEALDFAAIHHRRQKRKDADLKIPYISHLFGVAYILAQYGFQEDVVVAGVLFAINLMPLWLPGLTFSAVGSEPKIFWFLSRGSAIAAYWILWLAMSMGIMTFSKAENSGMR